MMHADLIRKLGGPVALAERLGLPVTTVLHWSGRGIGYRHLPIVLDLARKSRIKVTLAELVASKPATPARPKHRIESRSMADGAGAAVQHVSGADATRGISTPAAA